MESKDITSVLNLWMDKGIVFFKPHEFDSPDAPGSGCLMNLEFMIILNKIRHDCGFPFVINSGYRSLEHNTKVAEVELSAHTLGLAADIRISGSRERFLLQEKAQANGIRRLGIGRTYVHLDLDLSKPQGVMWDYYK